MKYVLVDNNDNINTTVDLASNIGISGARTYFIGTKQLDKKKFEAIPLLHKKDILFPYLINEGLKPQFLKLDDFVGKKKGVLRNLIIIFKNILKITPYINKKNIDIIHLNDSSAGLSWILPTKISH